MSKTCCIAEYWRMSQLPVLQNKTTLHVIVQMYQTGQSVAQPQSVDSSVCSVSSNQQQHTTRSFQHWYIGNNIQQGNFNTDTSAVLLLTTYRRNVLTVIF